jgi:hypothetical protein
MCDLVRKFALLVVLSALLMQPSYAQQFPESERQKGEEARREKPRFKSTTIIFYDEDGKITALETAGLYVPATGKTLYSDDELWKER